MESTGRSSLLSYWDLLTLVGFVALAAVYAWAVPRLPDPVPTHFNAAGRADGWTPKADLPQVVFGLPLLIAGAVFGAGALAGRAQKDAGRARVASLLPLRGLLGFGLPLLVASGLLVPVAGTVAIHAGAGCLLACVLLGIVLTAWEMKVHLSDAPDASLYRWGMFYVNPQDPRL